MEFSQQTQDASTGERRAYVHVTPPRRRPPSRIPTRDNWQSYERAKRRLAAQYGPGSEAYDEALRQYLEDAGL